MASRQANRRPVDQETAPRPGRLDMESCTLESCSLNQRHPIAGALVRKWPICRELFVLPVKLSSASEVLGCLVNSLKVFYDPRELFLGLFRYTKVYQTLRPNFRLHFLKPKTPLS